MMIGHMHLGTREAELRSAVYMWVLQNLIGSRAIVSLCHNHTSHTMRKEGAILVFLDHEARR